MKDREIAISYIYETFSGKGAARRSGPNLKAGGLFKRGLHYFVYPRDIMKKFNIYKTIKSNPQTDFVIFQEYIPHDFEWRVVRIGDSFFAHNLFESKRGYLVNEMQCLFGQSDPYQMLINGKEGRYQHTGGSWLFEEGRFNKNQCYNLRVEHVIQEFSNI